MMKRIKKEAAVREGTEKGRLFVEGSKKERIVTAKRCNPFSFYYCR